MTGGASGIGAAIVAALEADGTDVEVLDLRAGFDVGNAHDWESVTPADLVCLNAGVDVGDGDIRLLGDEEYRRALRTNVDGVVFGVRQLAPLMRRGSAFVVTASLASGIRSRTTAGSCATNAFTPPAAATACTTERPALTASTAAR